MKKILLTAIAFFCLLVTGAQETGDKKIKEFNAWIRLNNNPGTVKGLLYEIGDSSIFVVSSKFDTSRLEYKFNNIDILKVRNRKSVRRGAIIGSLIGFGGGTIVGLAFLGDMGNIGVVESIYAAGMSSLIGITYGLIGGGIGALAGTIKDRYPLKSSFENFDKYRGNLQDYSYLHEENAVAQKFKHRGYTGFSLGLSFPLDEFCSGIPLTDYKGMAKVGSGFTLYAGYRFTENIGVSGSMRNNMYSLNGDFSPLYWGYDVFMAGPVFSLPVSDKLSFDLTPRMGYATAYLMGEEEELITGEGLGINISGSMVYNISKRWFISAEAGYNLSEQDYGDYGNGKVRAIDIDLGLAYKFGNHSL